MVWNPNLSQNVHLVRCQGIAKHFLDHLAWRHCASALDTSIVICQYFYTQSAITIVLFHRKWLNIAPYLQFPNGYWVKPQIKRLPFLCLFEIQLPRAPSNLASKPQLVRQPKEVLSGPRPLTIIREVSFRSQTISLSLADKLIIYHS